MITRYRGWQIKIIQKNEKFQLYVGLGLCCDSFDSERDALIAAKAEIDARLENGDTDYY